MILTDLHLEIILVKKLVLMPFRAFDDSDLFMGGGMILFLYRLNALPGIR